MCVAVSQKVLNDLQVCVVLRLHVCKILVRLHESSLESSLFQKSVWTLARWLHSYIKEYKRLCSIYESLESSDEPSDLTESFIDNVLRTKIFRQPLDQGTTPY